MKKRIKLYFPIILIAGLFLGGCFSLGSSSAAGPALADGKRGLSESDVTGFIEVINNRDVTLFLKGVQIPFLLDGEPVVVKSDLESFWVGYLDGGVSLEEAVIAEIRPLSEGDADLMGDSMDIKLFFKKYLKKNSFLVDIRAGGYRNLFILVPTGGKVPEILGYKGPGL